MAADDDRKEIKYLESYQHSLLALLQETLSCVPAPPETAEEEPAIRRKVLEPS